MASHSNAMDLASNLSHVYFFIPSSSNTVTSESIPVPGEASTTSNGAPERRSRASSPGSIETDTTAKTTTTTSSYEMNPLAAIFTPQATHPRLTSVPPPPAATQLFELRQTPDRGFGLFATSWIARGTLIICESPLIRITGERLYSAWGPYCRLSEDQKAEYDTLHGYQAENLNFEQESRRYLIDPNDSSLDEEDIRELVADHVRVMSIFSVNNFRMPPSDLGIFATASRLNHACLPNVHHSYNPTLKSFTVYAAKDIELDEELCTTYLGSPGHYWVRSQRIEHLRSHYGFTCRCVACSDLTVTSDGRRELMGSIAWGLAKFDQGAASTNAFIPGNATAALRQAENLISVMLAERIVTTELMKAYRAASKQALDLKDYDKALEYARDQAEVEKNCLGMQVDDLKRLGVASASMFEEIDKVMGAETGTASKQEGQKKSKSKRKKKEPKIHEPRAEAETAEEN